MLARELVLLWTCGIHQRAHSRVFMIPPAASQQHTVTSAAWPSSSLLTWLLGLASPRYLSLLLHFFTTGWTAANMNWSHLLTSDQRTVFLQSSLLIITFDHDWSDFCQCIPQRELKSKPSHIFKSVFDSIYQTWLSAFINYWVKMSDMPDLTLSFKLQACSCACNCKSAGLNSTADRWQVFLNLNTQLLRQGQKNIQHAICQL